jgi:hypothetical protein
MNNKSTIDKLWRRAKGKAGESDSKLQARHLSKAPFQSPVLDANPALPAEKNRPGSNLVVTARRRDHWVDAGAKLKNAKPEIYETLLSAIEDGSKDSSTLQERISSVLSHNIATITDRQWRIRWGSRLNVQMRGMLEGVVKALEMFKDVGTAAASLDPVHAGLPMAAVCVLLPLVLNLPDQENAAKIGLDNIATIVARYSAMEQAYTRQGDLSLSKVCEDSIVELYTKILEYQAIAAAFFDKSTTGRYINAVFNPRDFNGVMKEVREWDEECTKCIRALEAEVSEKSGNRLESLLATAEKILEAVQSQNVLNRKIGLWLSDHRYGADHNRARNALGSAYSASGQWSLKGQSYIDWKAVDDRKSPVLWLRGTVGTGKTSLTSIVNQNHLEDLGSSDQERLAYFYCSESVQPPTTALIVFRSLLLQLAWSSDGLTICDKVKTLYETANHTSGSGKPDIERCVSHICALSSACPRRTIIIDALDECADYWVLLEGFEKINQVSSDNHLLFFFSSRMNVDVSKYFLECAIVGLEGNSQDIETYIKTQMANPRQRLLAAKHPDLEKRLEHVLIARAQNM